MAELFESPIPTTANVARLRRKFGSGEDDIDSESDVTNENEEAVQQKQQRRQQKTPKM
jgi:hypothetical protein